MVSLTSAINVNRSLVLAVFKATDARRSDAAEEWDTEAVQPEGAWSAMSSYLFIGGLTAEGLFGGVLILASALTGGQVPLYLFYLFLTFPLICAVSGEIECKIGQMRAEREIRRSGRLFHEDPQFNVHLVKNNHVLLRSSLVGILVAFSVALPLAAVNPLR